MRMHALFSSTLRFSRSFFLFVPLASVCALSSAAANILSLQGSGGLLPNTAGQQVTLLMSGSDFYTDSNLRFKINGGVGPAPRVTHIFGDTGFDFAPTSVLDGSIWQGGNGGIGIKEFGTYPGASGLGMLAAFLTSGSTSQNTPGVYTVLTVSTVGVPMGSYTLDLTGTDLFNGFEDNSDFPIPAPLELANITLGIGIETSPSPATQISLANTLAQSTPTDLPGAVQVSNSGFLADVLTVEAATITGPNAELFEILGGFSPRELLAGDGPLSVGLRFLGASAPGTYTAKVTFTFSDGPSLAYPLAVTIVPEPSTYALAAIGVATLLAVRRRRSSLTN